MTMTAVIDDEDDGGEDGEERREEEEEEEEKKKAEKSTRATAREPHRAGPTATTLPLTTRQSSSPFGFTDAGFGLITIVIFSGRVIPEAKSLLRVAECPALSTLDDLFYCCIQSVALRLTTSSQWRRRRASNRYV